MGGYVHCELEPQFHAVCNPNSQFYGDGRGAANWDAQGAGVREESQGRVAVHGPRRGGYCAAVLLNNSKVCLFSDDAIK